jgi:hypothetical protein
LFNVIRSWFRKIANKIIWIFYPGKHRDESLIDVIVRFVGGWIGLVFLSAMLGMGYVTITLIFLPIIFVMLVLKYGSTVLGGAKLAEDAGLVSGLPAWVSIARILLLPVGFLQDLTTIGQLVGGAKDALGRIDWSKAGGLLVSLAVKIALFIKSVFRR